MAERHHGFRSRAVPACGQVFLEQHDLNAFIRRNVGRLYIVYRQAAEVQGRGRTKGVDDFIFVECPSQAFFDFCDYILQIGGGSVFSASGQYLHDKDRIYLRIMLLITILIPMGAFGDPFVRGRLQNCHIIMLFRVFWVSDNDTVL